MYVDGNDEKFRETISKYACLSAYARPLKRMSRKLVGRDAEVRSLAAAFERPELSNVILLGEAGSGKAFDDDTEIAVADERGYIRIGDIKVGDVVFDETGAPTEVIGVYPQGLKDAYGVRFGSGETLVCCDEHLWSVRNRSGHYKNAAYSTMSLRELIDAGIRKPARHSSGTEVLQTKWWVPANGAVRRSEVALPLDPYVLGVLIGDGYLCDVHHNTLVLSSDDAGVVEAVRECLGVTRAVRVSERNYSWCFERQDYASDGDRGRYVMRRTVFCDDMFDVVDGRHSADRRIPAPYLSGSIAQRQALLQGLMDTDGCVTGSGGRVNCSFSTKSEGLAQDVRTLAASLGYRTSLHAYARDDDRHGGSPEFEVFFAIPLPERVELFKYSAKRERCERLVEQRVTFSRRYDDMPIEEVVDLCEQRPMTCIRVAAESHLFQVGRGHIVTHNTALVQGNMMQDSSRIYLEVDLSRMISELGNVDELGDRLKTLFGEAAAFSASESHGVVLFIDEFHQIVQLSPAAVEALKPLLADSATRGIRVIAATTYVEFRKFISPNQPLVERFHRINLSEPDKATCIQILKGMAQTYGVADRIIGDSLYEQIYDVTNRYVPANAQPRKSILVLDAMVGWYRAERRKLDKRLLADVIFESEGVNIAFRVEPKTIQSRLDEKVLAQRYATRVVAERLQLCVADLNDHTRPMSTFLFAGSTGTGKGTTAQTPIPVMPTEQNGFVSYKLAKDIVVGDVVFGRHGQPETVVGVFPQGLKDVYKVTLGDGRELVVDGSHLWGVYPSSRSRLEGLTIYSTETLIAKGLTTRHKGNRTAMKYVIPMNEAVQWPEQMYATDPYVVGVAIGDGCLTAPTFTISSDDAFVLNKVARLIGAKAFDRSPVNYDNVFWTGEVRGGQKCRVQTVDVVPSSLVGVKSPERRIPVEYMVGSIDQRWRLVNGLFDTDGHIGQSDGDRFNVGYSTRSKGLAEDVQQLLFSLGVGSSIVRSERDNGVDYCVHVKSRNCDKWRFFTLPCRLEIAKRAAGVNKQREKTFDYVGIRSIEKLPNQDETYCLYVDDDEHLYQAGQFVVTHNTELVKQLSNLLFGDATRSLIRLDMTEFANASSLERFRLELTTRVWEHPYCIILLDEVEKACAEVTRVLLSVLDDARLTDQNGREVSFLNAYIVLTTNAGSEIYKTIAQYESSDTGEGDFIARYDKLIRRSLVASTGNRFPPELLGRVDVIVPFQPLSRQTMGEIVVMNLKRLRDELFQKHGVKLSVNKRVIPYLIEDALSTDSDAGGARAVMGKLQSEVTTQIASFVNAHPDAKDIVVQVEGELASENKSSRVGNAYIRVVGRA